MSRIITSPVSAFLPSALSAASVSIPQLGNRPMIAFPAGPESMPVPYSTTFLDPTVLITPVGYGSSLSFGNPLLSRGQTLSAATAERKPLRQHAKEYLEYLRKYEVKKPLTIKMEHSGFFGRFQGTSLFDELDRLGVFYPEDVNRDNTWQLYCAIKGLIRKINYRTKKIGAYRHLLEHLMDEVIPRDDELLKLLKTSRWLPAKPSLPSEAQLKLLEEWAFSEKTFTNYRDSLMIYVLVGICGLRPGEEVSRVRIDKIDFEKCEIEIWRKNDREKTVKFPAWVRPYLRTYLKLRAELMGADADRVPFLFIKHNPNQGRKKKDPDWRLSKYGFWARISMLKKDYPILHGLKPYFLRHWAVTVHVYNAKEEGISMDEVGYEMDHSPRVCMTFYNGRIGAAHELLQRTPKEKIEFIKSRIRDSILKYIEHPDKPEHLSSAIEWRKKLGRTQNGIDLTEYVAADDSELDITAFQDRHVKHIDKSKIDLSKLLPILLNDKLPGEARSVRADLIQLLVCTGGAELL
jgi:site-specific recombinase XerD